MSESNRMESQSKEVSKENSPDIWQKSAVYKINGEEFKLTLGQIYHEIASGTIKPTYPECMMFLHLCRVQKLNPYLNEAYLLKYSSNTPAQIITSKEAFEKRASQCEFYDGKKAGIIIERDGKIIEVEGSFYLPTDKLVGGWCAVYRKDRRQPTYISVSFEEYVGRKKDGTPNSMWSSSGKPATMIRKVAVVQALRESFPNELNGMFMDEEMQSSRNPTKNELKKDVPSPLHDIIKNLEIKTAQEKELAKKEANENNNNDLDNKANVNSTDGNLDDNSETEKAFEELYNSEQALEGIKEND